MPLWPPLAPTEPNRRTGECFTDKVRATNNGWVVVGMTVGIVGGTLLVAFVGLALLLRASPYVDSAFRWLAGM